jgi:hypothetical protein
MKNVKGIYPLRSNILSSEFCDDLANYKWGFRNGFSTKTYVYCWWCSTKRIRYYESNNDFIGMYIGRAKNLEKARKIVLEHWIENGRKTYESL